MDRVHVIIRYEVQEEACGDETFEKHSVVPIINCCLPNGESFEHRYSSGTIISKKGDFGATKGATNTLIYNDQTYSLGLCPGGKIHGYEIIIFNKIKRGITCKIRALLKNLGYTNAKFNTTSGYNIIWVTL